MKKFRHLDIFMTLLSLVTVILFSIFSAEENGHLHKIGAIRSISRTHVWLILLNIVCVLQVVTFVVFRFAVLLIHWRQWSLIALLFVQLLISVFFSFYNSYETGHLIKNAAGVMVKAERMPALYWSQSLMAFVLFNVLLFWKIFYIGFSFVSKSDLKNILRRFFLMNRKGIKIRKAFFGLLSNNNSNGSSAKNKNKAVHHYVHPLLKKNLEKKQGEKIRELTSKQEDFFKRVERIRSKISIKSDAIYKHHRTKLAKQAALFENKKAKVVDKNAPDSVGKNG